MKSVLLNIFLGYLIFFLNEVHRSLLRGIEAELRRSLTRLRSGELLRGSPCLSSLQPRWAGFSFHSYKLQGIQAKANKTTIHSNYLMVIELVKIFYFLPA